MPSLKITWIISEPAYQLVKTVEEIDFIVIKKPHSIHDYWQLFQQFRNLSFDVLLAMQASLRANLIYPLIKAKRKIGYDKKRGKDGHTWFISESIPYQPVHTLMGFMQFAEKIIDKPVTIRWDIPLPDDAILFANQYVTEKKKLILIHPAASKPERTWTIEGYVTVIQHIQQRKDCHVILIGGPTKVDALLEDAILKQISVESLVGKTTPLLLLALMKKASLLICPDTGPSHMGASVNCPIIALHAVTDPEISGPFGQINDTINAYPEALKRYGHVKHPAFGYQVHHPLAMRLIEPSIVSEKIECLFKPN